jgi:hypothetical protein
VRELKLKLLKLAMKNEKLVGCIVLWVVCQRDRKDSDATFDLLPAGGNNHK